MHTFFVTSTHSGAGLTSISLGLIRALENKGLKVGFFNPIAFPYNQDQSSNYASELIEHTLGIKSPHPFSKSYLEQKYSANQLDVFLEELLGLFYEFSHNKDVMVVQGITPSAKSSYANVVNAAIAKALNADIVMVTTPDDTELTELVSSIEVQAHAFGGLENDHLVGVIVNKIPDQGTKPPFDEQLKTIAPDLFNKHLKLLGTIAWNEDINTPRLKDIATQLNAKVINEGEFEIRRVKNVVLCSRNAPDTIPLLEAGTLVITPSDRTDIIMTTCLAALNGTPLAGLLLCTNVEADMRTMKLCQSALTTGLPILRVDTPSFETANNIFNIDKGIALDDQKRAKQTTNFITDCLDSEWLFNRCEVVQEKKLTPAAFRYQLIKRAQEANKRIVLPEGDEPRTIQAAIICQQKKIARCVLLAKPEIVQRIASELKLTIPSDLEIIDPVQLSPQYIDTLVELRKHKGMTPATAEKELEDTVMLGTLMLAADHVDGLVSGAVHTTANTVRPALQIIKTSPDYNLVSSVFFMLLPDQVLVYGDCAINPNPTSEQLADIAIQSAESAAAFGIPARVAMISYSTGSSGAGIEVEKVSVAVELAKQKRPDLLLDGPLQYDAASVESVGKQKAPNSQVAGKATVFVFPDLNTGNTTYKAVQRSANVISIGPVLQGLRKPVNDLSRGALVEDIVFAIALTAIQANN